MRRDGCGQGLHWIGDPEVLSRQCGKAALTCYQFLICTISFCRHRFPADIIKANDLRRCFEIAKETAFHHPQKLGACPARFNPASSDSAFMSYDLGYIDLEKKTLQTIDNPFGTRLSPMP